PCTATTCIHTISLHDALPICASLHVGAGPARAVAPGARQHRGQPRALSGRQAVRIAAEETARRRLGAVHAVAEFGHVGIDLQDPDRKSTRLNSSHVKISYAVF